MRSLAHALLMSLISYSTTYDELVLDFIFPCDGLGFCVYGKNGSKDNGCVWLHDPLGYLNIMLYMLSWHTEPDGRFAGLGCLIAITKMN